jgi:hypothetical protein
MSPAKEQRKGFLGGMDRLIALVDGIKGLFMIAAALSVGGASGTLLASDGVSRAESTAIADSVASAHADTLRDEIAELRQRQMDMFTAQVESDTALRAVLQRRAADKEKAAAERQAVERLINLGGTP